MGPAYMNLSIPNATATAFDLKVNTLMRIVNACFHPDFIEKFLQLNDTKRRKDMEQTGGTSPLKVFWMDVSEFVNDSLNNPDLSIFLDSKEDEDVYLHEIMTEKQLNLNDFNQGTHKSCAKHMLDMMKCRNKIRASMTRSGSHSDTPRTYLNAKHLKLTKAVIIPGPPVYYLDKQCLKHPSIDSAYATVLHGYLKSCSMGGLGEDAVDDEDSKSTKSSKHEDFISQFKEVSEDMAIHQETANAQRATLIEMQRLSITTEQQRAEEERNRSHWAEYIQLSETVRNLQGDHQLGILKNVAKRVRVVEKLCGIDEQDSIVGDVDM